MADHRSTIEAALAGLLQPDLNRLVERIDAIRLYAHAYALHLNLRFGTVRPHDLLTFAAQHRLVGLSIHVDDGERGSLGRMSGNERAAFGAEAQALGIDLHVETSATDFDELKRTAGIARNVGATSIRCYPRYEGRVSEIMGRTIADLRRIDEIDPEHRFRFTIEQHEDLRSQELVAIVQAVANPRLGLLFDFGNMINAGETPLDALAVMAPLVSEVHIKDVKAEPDRGGMAQRACRSGEGDIPFQHLLVRLLLLGDDAPQVVSFALQEENGMWSPARRLPNDPADPFIAMRAASTTEPPTADQLAGRLAAEHADAIRQVAYVRSLLAVLRLGAQDRLAPPPRDD